MNNLYSVRVSNELGKGNAKAAIFSIKVILGTSITIGVVFWILCLAFGNKISYWFTSDEEVAEAVSSLSTLLAFSMLLNSVQPVLTGECFIFYLFEMTQNDLATS
jgi:MATE family multidrug resistance protein